MFTTPELKYNWRFMDKYGYDPKFTTKKLRKIKLKKLNGEEVNDIFEDNILFLHMYDSKKDTFDFLSASYRQKDKELRIEGLKFRINSIIEAENLIQSYIIGSKLVIGEIYKK